MELISGHLAVAAVNPARTVLVDVALIGMADIRSPITVGGCQRCGRSP